MHRIILFILSFTSFICFSQTKNNLPNKNFTKQWQSDFTGKMNFRNSNIIYSKVKRTILINGIDIRGFNKEKVNRFLGKPNESGIGKEDKLLIMIYTTKWFKSKGSDEILVYFNEKNKVNAIIKSEDKSYLYFKK